MNNEAKSMLEFCMAPRVLLAPVGSQRCSGSSSYVASCDTYNEILYCGIPDPILDPMFGDKFLEIFVEGILDLLHE